MTTKQLLRAIEVYTKLRDWKHVAHYARQLVRELREGCPVPKTWEREGREALIQWCESIIETVVENQQA